ncbi:DUF6328 family protein [Streptomyces lunalinharesii]|uniref:DUF6328 family protein n=1 Tax=Streptomyces lunalinharesii TaxID=333384 RepID=A0ABN3SLF3_9ACTN
MAVAETIAEVSTDESVPDPVSAQPSSGEIHRAHLDREYAELLQEIRVAQTGVQMLMAFLLAMAFTPRFEALGTFQRGLYLTALLLAAGATAMLIAPAPIHRLLLNRGLREELVKLASRLAVAGLTLLMASIVTALLLIFDVVLGRGTASVLAALTLAWFAAWWYVFPMRSRSRARR